MADTTFVNNVTLTDADWFNDLNRLHYTIFGDPADDAAARTNLGLGALATLSTTINLGTPQNTTSGNTINFGSIPTGTKRVVINFVGVSTDGTDNWLIQLGDSGGIEPSGYLGAGAGIPSGSSPAVSNYTSGFGIRIASASAVLHGSITLTLVNSSTFTWACSGTLANSAAAEQYTTSGSKSLSAELTQISITTTGGTNAFDAGSINIVYE